MTGKRRTGQVKDPGMMGGGPEETHGGTQPGDRGEERDCWGSIHAWRRS